MELSPATVNRFHDDGFLVFEQLASCETVETLRQAYDAILDREIEAELDGMLGGITRQVMMPSLAHSVFDDNAALDTAKVVATRLLDAPVVRTFDMLIDKPPGHPHETPWHQDMSYARMPTSPAGLEIPLDTIQFWIALDDVDEENGCMHFVPGYHQAPLLEHQVASGRPDESTRLLALVNAEHQLDLDRAVAAPLPAGGATVHSYGTPHQTPPNRSADRPRRAYIVNLAAEHAIERLMAEAGIHAAEVADALRDVNSS